MKATGPSIALVGPLPPPSGGMANQTRQLQFLLQQEGLRVEVAQVNAPYQPAWVGNIRGLRAVFRFFPYLFRLWRIAGSTQLLHVMANSGKSWFMFAAPAVWMAVLRRKPVIVNYRGGKADSFFRDSMPWVRSTLIRADRIIVPSPYLEQVFARWRFSTRVVPNIIDVERFDAGPPASHTDPAETPYPRILVARNLELIYDIATAIRALRIVKDEIESTCMTIVGSGPECSALQQLAHEIGLTDAIAFVGEQDNHQMPDLYRSADVVVNPSLADNMPISILEALASGTPVVSTNVGGVPHMVKDGETALLVPPGDASAMAAAILRLVRVPGLSKRLSESGRKYVHQFTWSKVREKLFATYEELIQLDPVGDLQSDDTLRTTAVTAGSLTIGHDNDRDRA